MSTTVRPLKFSTSIHGFNTQLMHFKSCLLSLTNFLRAATHKYDFVHIQDIGCLKFLVFLLSCCFKIS